MHQKRICEYFDLPCRHTRTFLHLPPLVRRQIYINAGLMVGEDIVLRYRPPEEPWQLHLVENPNYEQETHHTLAQSLLQTCREINDEVSGILRSENRIVVSHQHLKYGLEYLSRLSPQACSDLRDLYIHLYLLAPPDPRYSQSQTFQRSKHLSQTVIAAWHKAASHVLTHSGQRRLSLHLICDTGQGEETASVLQPLEDHQGVLKECHIRLHPRRNSRISSLARSVALRATGQHRVDEQQPFRFMDLPPELRHRILLFTDLVTPWNEVDWMPNRYFRVTFGSFYSQCYGTSEVGHFVPWDPHPWQFISCSPLYAEVAGCFCEAEARMSGYSSTCRCWVPPVSLMLVSRAMYQQAIAVLYTQNRVVVVPNPKQHLLSTGISTSALIGGHINYSTLSYLRNVEFILPITNVPHVLHPLQQDGTTHSSPPSPYLDWCSAVDHLKRWHGNLGSMKIVAQLRSGQNRRSFERQLMASAESSDHEALLKPHRVMLEPLKKLREGGLQRLFVFVEWDRQYWVPPHRQTPELHLAWLDGPKRRRRHRLHGVELLLERDIMGQDYDSLKVGKLNWYPSQWMMELE